MTLRDFPLFVDENLLQAVVTFLRSQNLDATSVRELGLEGRKDLELLPIATAEGRVIVTQDSDFGQIVFTQSIDFVGIIHLRPGHFNADFHIQTLKVLFEQNPPVEPPFIVTAEHKAGTIRIRVRNVRPGPSSGF